MGGSNVVYNEVNPCSDLKSTKHYVNIIELSLHSECYVDLLDQGLRDAYQ